MKTQLNELVQRLTAKQDVECVRPKKTSTALKECIDRNYVHVMFRKTGTEVGVKLDRKACKFDGVNFEQGIGKVLIVGGLTLNYDRVRCVAEIDLSSCEGEGFLEPVSEAEYAAIMK